MACHPLIRVRRTALVTASRLGNILLLCQPQKKVDVSVLVLVCLCSLSSLSVCCQNKTLTLWLGRPFEFQAARSLRIFWYSVAQIATPSLPLQNWRGRLEPSSAGGLGWWILSHVWWAIALWICFGMWPYSTVKLFRKEILLVLVETLKQ